ncbi:MAG: cob(I)yrinic acid a,c-diamide adenosyltransferase [Bdellovibrionota bacterium]
MTTPPKASIYTGTGDKGQTRLVTGECVSKSDVRVVAYGNVDELNSFIGLARSALHKVLRKLEKQGANSANGLSDLKTLFSDLEKTQNHLFNLGSRLATADESKLKLMPVISDNHIEALEKAIDVMTEQLPPLKEFILPGGHELSSRLHVCRTVCRRTEREMIPVYEKFPIYQSEVIYLNRLSDYFFVAARYTNFLLNVTDHVWDKNL